MSSVNDLSLNSVDWVLISTKKNLTIQHIGGTPVRVCFAASMPQAGANIGFILSDLMRSVTYQPTATVNNCYARLVEKSNDTQSATLAILIDD